MENKTIKFMLLGLMFIGIALFIQGEPGLNMHGNEFFIALVGCIIIVFGFFI